MKLASSRFRHATFVESLLSVTCTVLILIFLFVAGGEDLGINAECGFSATTVQEQATRVFVDPPNSTANVGENYTISVKIANVTNLAGFSIGIRWGSAVLRYRSHEVYPDNVIFNPWLIREELNQTYGVSEAPPGTIYLVAYASLPSAGFNGSGTVFNMTFHVLRDGECSISFTVSELSTPGPSPSPISHTLADGYFFKPGLGKVPVAEFTVQGGKKPGTAVENRITIFNASASYDQDPLGNIALYIWNFGDGVTANTTDPVTAHNYTNLLSTPYLSFYLQVELTVLDDQLDGSQSQPKHESLEIVHPRPVANFTFWPRIAVIGKTVIFNASSSYDPDPDGTIVLYSWYFWTSYSVNTTNPVINLTFADAYTYAVFLTVYDSEGLNDVEAHAVPVVESRDVEVASVTTSTTKFMQGKDVGLNATVFNRGQADETFNITAYYNKTATEWEKIDELVAKRVPGQNRTLSPSYPVEPIVWYLTQRESTCSPANNKLYSHWDSLGPSDTSTRVRAGDDSGYWTVNPRSINAESNSSTLVAGTPLETGGWTLEKEFALGPMLINGDFSSGNWTVSLKLFATADGITATIWMRVLKSDNPNFQAAEANVEVLKNWTCLFEPVILSTQANLITSRLPMPISLFDYEYLYVEFQLEVTENDAVGSDAEVAFEVEGFTDPLSLARIEPTAFSSKEEYTLRWNTEGVPPGNYAVKVVLSEVPHETNATNNIRVSENTLVVLVEGRDIALTAVNLSKSVVGQGFPLIVNLTVRNFGSVQETFNITLYANETIIETLTSTVAERTASIMTCCWNTTGFAKGAYILWANASSVPGELDTSDNISADHAIFITIAGDVDEDRDVDLSDAIEFVRCYRVHPILNPNADIDEDGDVDIYDVVILCGNYGKSW